MNITQQLRSALGAAALAVFSAQALAVPLWDETVDGDLSSVTTAAAATDLGLITNQFNEINGTLDGGNPNDSASGTDEYDLFKFTTTGAWSLDIDLLTLDGTASVLLYDYDALASLGFYSAPTLDATTGGAGTFALGLIPEGNRGMVEYGLTIYLPNPPTSAPAPVTAALVALGLAGFAARRRT